MNVMGRKIQISLLILALIGLLVGGTSIAYFSAEDDMNKAKFTTTKIKVDFAESAKVDAIGGHTDEREVGWTIENTGDSNVYLRAKVIHDVGLEDLGIDGRIGLTALGVDWKKGGDEYYYYKNAVSPEEQIEFCIGVTFDVWESVECFSIDIEVEAIQASNNAIRHVWPDNPFGI